MVIGKGGAILQGFSDTTQDVDLFVRKHKGNQEKLISALEEVGVPMKQEIKDGIRNGKDFIQIGSTTSM